MSLFRLAVLGKLNNFVKEWIAEISEIKVGFVKILSVIATTKLESVKLFNVS